MKYKTAPVIDKKDPCKGCVGAISPQECERISEIIGTDLPDCCRGEGCIYVEDKINDN